MALLDELASYIEAEGHGTVGTDIFKSFMPATPDACVAVYETGGSSPDLGFGSTTVRFENPSVQILARGAAEDYTGPRTKAQSVWDSLVAVQAPQQLSGTSYNLIIPLQSPFPIGPDENKRQLISANFLIEKSPSTGGGGPASPAVVESDGHLQVRVWNTTTDATPTELFRDGSSLRVVLAQGVTAAFVARIVGQKSDGSETAHYEYIGTISNIGGTTALDGTPRLSAVTEDDTAWTVAVSADDTNDALVFKVTGAAATTIKWDAIIDLHVVTL